METAISVGAALLSAVAVLLSFRKQRKLTLAQAASMGVDSAEQLVKAPSERLMFAMDVVRKLDVSADGRRDWNDAQIRLAVEAAVKGSK